MQRMHTSFRQTQRQQNEKGPERQLLTPFALTPFARIFEEACHEVGKTHESRVQTWFGENEVEGPRVPNLPSTGCDPDGVAG